MEENIIIENKELSIWEALIPVVALVSLIGYNVYIYGDDALSGSNQFALLIGAAVGGIIGFRNKVSYKQMLEEIGNNLKSISGAVLILLLVGALAGTWLLSGVIPTLIYGGLKLLSPSIFLPASAVICAIISLATGSSWATSATVGIALIGIGGAIGFPLGMVAGAVISGSYFGDKMSPLSDTTNLAPAMAGTDLFTHIRYMTYTTVPSFIVALVVFSIIGATRDTSGVTDTTEILSAIDASFNVTPWLALVPVIVVVLIINKTKPVVALFLGGILGGVFALIFQPDIVAKVAGAESLTVHSAYKGVMNALTVETVIETSNPALNDLFTSGGMNGMLNTVWLLICAMVFGGVMDAIGALAKLSKVLLSFANSTFSLFASTLASCLAINVTASDQYLAIVIPGKMFAQAYKDKGLAPENLSRTLEDSGTVTSVLIPWNTCGAYHAGVLGVPVFDYFIYAVFNFVSPFMTLLFAAFHIKIKTLSATDN
jgi:NhaC family Na+:H+ antiporter